MKVEFLSWNKNNVLRSAINCKKRSRHFRVWDNKLNRYAFNSIFKNNLFYKFDWFLFLRTSTFCWVQYLKIARKSLETDLKAVSKINKTACTERNSHTNQHAKSSEIIPNAQTCINTLKPTFKRFNRHSCALFFQKPFIGTGHGPTVTKSIPPQAPQ